MIGKRLAHFEIVEQIGEGGMGTVYRARDTRLDRDVALKVLPPEFARDAERVARFRREARLLASLHHTHIAALFGLEEVDQDLVLVMELVEGEDLSQRLRRGPLALDEALDLARQFAEGLEAAHEQGVVHRDLKPANLKVTSENQLKILDFGLARAYSGDGVEAEDLEASPTITAALTGQGVILGTAAYMSPEQARGRKVDHRSDIWAFGVILFEMLSGRRLFRGETISDTMAAVLREEIPWDSLPPEVPRGVVRLLERCLERDGRRRLRDIGEARVRLERWRDDPESMHESYVSGTHTAPMEPSKRTRVGMVAMGALALVFAGLFSWQLLSREHEQAPDLDIELGILDFDEMQPAGNSVTVAPNGRWLAWVTGKGVMVRALNSRRSRLLDGTMGAMCMTFSPDSQWLAVALVDGLHRVSVAGGTPIRLGPMPTPRGIAWVDERTLVVAPTISSGLFEFDVATGEQKPLTELDYDRNERSHRWPTVVPGTRKIVYACQFIGRDYDESDIMLVDLDERVPKIVHRGGTAPRATRQGQLLFVRGSSLFALHFDPKSGETWGLPTPVRDHLEASSGNQEDDDGSAEYVLDDRGTLFYVDNGGGDSPMTRLTWYDFETGQFEPFGDASEMTGVDIAPDGQRAVVSRIVGGNENLFVVDFQKGTESALTFRASVEYIGAWSPDSKTYYWSQASDSGDRFEIWRRPVDGSQAPEFVIAATEQAGIWPDDVSPDGRYLAATAWRGGSFRDVLLLDLRDPDAGLQPLVATAESEVAPHWFGNELFLYREGISASGDLGASIVLRRFPDTGAQWRFPEVEGGYYSAVPTRGLDRVIAFGYQGVYGFPISFDHGSLAIGPRETLRTITAADRRRFRAAALHPDGRKMLLLMADADDADLVGLEFVMVTNWVSQLDERLERGQ